jgi:hypothetical protein
LVLTRTLHEPSNGAVLAIEAEGMVQAANAVAKVSVRMIGLIMIPHVGLMAPSPNRRRLVCELEYQNSRW